METRAGSPIFWFGAGQLFRSLLWCATDLLIAFHLKIRVGLSGWTTGEILFLSFVFGAAFDLVVATAISRMPQPVRAALRLQAAGGCAAAVSAALLFGPLPHGTSHALLYLVLTSVLFRATYGVFDVSQNALTSLLPQNEPAVGEYVLVRTTLSSVGRLAASGLAVLAMRNQADQLADFKLIALIVIPVAISTVRLAQTPKSSLRTGVVGDGGAWRVLPYARLVGPLVAILCNVGLLGLLGRLLPVLPGHGVASDSAILFAMVCGTVFGPMLLVPLRRLGATSMSATIGLSIVAAGSGCALLVPQSPAVALMLATAYGAGQMAMTNIIWERVAKIIYEEAAASAIRIDVAAFALLTAFIKLGIAISNVFLGLVLDGLAVGGLTSTLPVVAILLTGGAGAALVLGLTGRPENRSSTPADVVISTP